VRQIRVRRVYEPADAHDGRRVLVDRLWPRGLRREAAQLDEWCREVAPSADLRRWYGHDPERFPEFRRRYRAELASGAGEAAVRRLRAAAGHGALTLLTASRDPAPSTSARTAALLGAPPGT
jgi:uncharacterized protein YeaO (DUF488 family)